MFICTNRSAFGCLLDIAFLEGITCRPKARLNLDHILSTIVARHIPVSDKRVQFTYRPGPWSWISQSACWWFVAPFLDLAKTRVDFLTGIVEGVVIVVAKVD